MRSWRIMPLFSRLSCLLFRFYHVRVFNYFIGPNVVEKIAADAGVRRYKYSVVSGHSVCRIFYRAGIAGII